MKGLYKWIADDTEALISKEGMFIYYKGNLKLIAFRDIVISMEVALIYIQAFIPKQV